MRVKKNVSNEYNTTTINGFEIVDGSIAPSGYEFAGSYPSTSAALEKVRVEHPTFTTEEKPTVSKTKKYVPVKVFNSIATDNENVADDIDAYADYIYNAIITLQSLLNEVNESRGTEDAKDNCGKDA